MTIPAVGTVVVFACGRRDGRMEGGTDGQTERLHGANFRLS